jgi:DNA replication protein DnaC
VSQLTTDRIKVAAATLGLSHLAEAITELSRRAEADQMGYLDFVDLLLQEELGIREGRRFQYALRASALPHQKTLDQFNFAFQPDLDIRKINDLATLQFVQTRANVAFLGPPRVGKTMLAVGLVVAACQAGFTIYFTTLDDLLRRLRAAEATSGSTDNSRPTCGHPCSSSTRSATCPSTGPKPTWSSNSSPAATNAAR